MVVIAVSVASAYQRGWHCYLWSHRVPMGIVAAPALVVVVWLSWSLGSPLFTNTTVDALFFTRIARTREGAMETQQLTFTLERETKNTVRYQEQTDVNPAVIGTVYIQKSTVGNNPPKAITVTISNAD
jgi:hypothetical protein